MKHFDLIFNKNSLFLMSFLIAFALSSSAQNDSIVRFSKLNTLESQKGNIIKFVDKKMSNIQYGNTGWGMSRLIRTYIQDNTNTYFVILGSSPTAAIEYSDLVKVNNAFERLFKDVDSDCALKPDYLEHRFTTDDGFRIGYYVQKGKAHWVVDLCTYYPLGKHELKKPYDFFNGLKEAQIEIERMKNIK